jgi:CRP-like cAMP-binding protein
MANGHHSHNLLLAALPAADFELMRPNLQTIDLPCGLSLVESGQIPTRTYFPHSGVIASTVSLSSGRVVEVRITGREGAVGAVTGTGHLASFTSAVVRIKGKSSVIDQPNFQMVFNRSQSLRALLARHEAVQQAMADQSVACNAAHDLEARLARRLLRLCTMSGQTEFTATQEVLAEMLGVQRNAISHVALRMREMNVISYSRGLLKIVDFDRLHRLSCECYDTVTSYRTALGSE